MNHNRSEFNRFDETDVWHCLPGGRDDAYHGALRTEHSAHRSLGSGPSPYLWVPRPLGAPVRYAAGSANAAGSRGPNDIGSYENWTAAMTIGS